MTNEELRKILVDNSDVADEILLRISKSGKELSDISVDEALGNQNAYEPKYEERESEGFKDLDQENEAYDPRQDNRPEWVRKSEGGFKEEEYYNYYPENNFTGSKTLPRSELKSLAKTHMKEQYGPLVKNVLLYLVITIGVSFLGSFVSSIAESTETPAGNIIASIILTVVSIASVILSCGMMVGYIKGFMNARRGERVGSLFEYFGNWLDVLKLSLLMLLKSVWPIIAAAVLLVVIVLLAGEDNPLMLIGIIPMLAGYGYMIYKAFAYALSMYIYADDRSKLSFKDASDILRKSSNMMKGQKLRYFVLAVSFIGWMLVAYLTMCLPLILMFVIAIIRSQINIVAYAIMIFVLVALIIIFMLPIMVYIQMAYTEFYDDLCGRDPRSSVRVERNLIRTPLIALAVACVLGIGLAFIPGTTTTLDSLTHGAGVSDPVIIDDYPDQNADDPSQGEVQGPGIIQNIDEGSGENVNGDTAETGSSIIPPEGYKVSYDEDGLIMLFAEDSADSITIYKNDFSYDDDLMYSSHSDAIKETVAGKEGYLYKDENGEYSTYGFISNTGNESSIEVVVSDPSTLDQIVRQL